MWVGRCYSNAVAIADVVCLPVLVTQGLKDLKRALQKLRF